MPTILEEAKGPDKLTLAETELTFTVLPVKDPPPNPTFNTPPFPVILPKVTLVVLLVNTMLFTPKVVIPRLV